MKEYHSKIANLFFIETRFINGTPTSLSVTSTHPPWPHKGHAYDNEWSTQVHFIPCQSALQFLRLGYFEVWHWKNQGHSHGCGEEERSHSWPSIQLICFLFISHEINNSWHGSIWNLTLELKVKVKGELKGQGDIVDPVSNQGANFCFTYFVWPLKRSYMKLWKKNAKTGIRWSPFKI